MNELMLDTANLEELEYGLSMWPISGVTSNPSILKKEGNIDVYERMRKIRTLCTNGRSLHIQVVSKTTEGIIDEAKTIISLIGHDTYIKIPVSETGLPAIKALAKAGGHSVYPLTKRWFLGTFEGFDVDKAKKEIANATIKSVKIKAPEAVRTASAA